MMRIYVFFVLVVFAASEIRAQTLPGGQGLCGTPTLADSAVIAQAWLNTLARSPGLAEAMRKQLLEEREAADTVGSQYRFWTYDFVKNTFDSVRAELMAVGSESYVWVALDELANTHVTMTEVNAILDALEHRTPSASRDSAKGILQLERDYYGNPPNINSNYVKGAGDGKTHFLILDIKDDWVTTGSYYAGYFFRVDVDPNATGAGYSNRRDLLYIDSYPGIYLNGVRDPQRPLSTLAHEFQHLIHWNYDPNEIDFFNEGLSEYAEYVCGYGLRSPSLYFSNPNTALLGWSQELADYSRAALWTLYLGEQYGEAFTRDLTQNPSRGVAGFDAAASAAGLSATFQSTTQNFLVANVVQDRAAGVQYGYIDQSAVQGSPAFFKDYFGTQAAFSELALQALASEYIRFRGADTLRFNISPASGSLLVRMARLTDSGVSVETVPAGSDVVGTFVGSTRAELILSIQNPAVSGSAAYSLQSSGTPRTSAILELSHDDGRTLTASNRMFGNNDTAFVVFGGVGGGKIDSVRMWFETAGSARLMVRDADPQFDYITQPLSGLGGASRMGSVPVSFSATDTTFFGTSIDLRTYNIRSEPGFVVELIYGTGAPDPVLRRDSAQGALFSYLFLASNPPPPGDRYLYASTGDFYVRVYLSPTNEPPPQPPVVPPQYVLAQNYPNPVNSSTTIEYSLPVPGPVTLRLYDLLGRQIMTLVDREETAQVHSVVVNTDRLASGVYLYRIVAGSFRDTKKLVVVR